MSRKATRSQPVKLLFSGYYGLGNAGDEAVLAGLLRGLREVGLEAEVTVLSASPAQTESWHGVRAVPRMKPALLRAIEECDVLVSGGGSLLQDVTSVASLGYYLSVIGLAKAMGKRVVIAAQGMGPLIRPASRRWTGSIVGRADLITVRDEDSAQLLQECGVRRPVHVTADPAFLLSDTVREGKRDRSSERPRIGLALRSWPDRDAAEWGAALCKSVASRGGAPILIPMHEPHDRELSEAIRKALDSPVEIAPPPDRLEDVLRAIGGCDAVIGMRLHALLLAAGAGIPTLAWSYDPKVDALAHRIGGGCTLLPLDAQPETVAEAALSSPSAPPDPTRIAALHADALRTARLIADCLSD